MHGGVARVYEVHIPPNYTGTTRVPLVMTIHGAHNTIAMVKGWSQMNPVADANGFSHALGFLSKGERERVRRWAEQGGLDLVRRYLEDLPLPRTSLPTG